MIENTILKKAKEMVSFLLVIVITSIIFIHFILKQLKPSKELAPLPPGPYQWPIVGNLFQMGKNIHVTLANLAQVHGPIMSLKLGSRMVVVGSSPSAAAEILKTHDRLLSGRYISKAVAVEGSVFHNVSLGFTDDCGESWKNIRGMYKSELFSAKAIESQVNLREEKVRDMLSYLCSKKGQVVKIKEVVHTCALNILSNICLSTDLVDFEGKGLGPGLNGYIRGFTALGASVFMSDILPILGKWKAKSFYNKLEGYFKNISSSWGAVIQEKRKAKQVSSQMDFVSVLINKGFSDKQINSLLLELFGAGTESTSATSEWMLTELLKNPEAMKNVREELSKVVGVDMVKEAHLPQLPYLEACLKETLRLHPPGPLLLFHRATETCQVMDYRIPKDSLVMVNMWAIARDPTIWKDATTFKPRRFLDSSIDYKGQDFTYIPFSSGRRFCTGQPLASRSIPLIVASLVHTFDWVLPNNMDPADIDMDDLADITMLKKNPLYASPLLRRE